MLSAAGCKYKVAMRNAFVTARWLSGTLAKASRLFSDVPHMTPALRFISRMQRKRRCGLCTRDGGCLRVEGVSSKRCCSGSSLRNRRRRINGVACSLVHMR